MQDRFGLVPDSANCAASSGIQPDIDAPSSDRPEYRAKLRRVIELLGMAIIPKRTLLSAQRQYNDGSCQPSMRDTLRSSLFVFCSQRLLPNSGKLISTHSRSLRPQRRFGHFPFTFIWTFLPETSQKRSGTRSSNPGRLCRESAEMQVMGTIPGKSEIVEVRDSRDLHRQKLEQDPQLT